MRHTLSVLVENRFGVLARVAGMFSGRGFNIDTLNVGPTGNPKHSRMTIVVRGDDKVLDQVTKQLYKLVDVIDIQDLGDAGFIDRELVLLKVKAGPKERSEIIQICELFHAEIIDVSHEHLTIEITSEEENVGKFLSLIEPFGLFDLARTGKIALPR